MDGPTPVYEREYRRERILMHRNLVVSLLVSLIPIGGANASDVVAKALPDPIAISISRATGTARLLRFAPGTALPGHGKSTKARVVETLIGYGKLLGVTDPDELVLVSSAADQLGQTHVSFSQTFQGVPVYGTMLRAHLDADEQLLAINGLLVPDVAPLNPIPVVPAVEAEARAVGIVAAQGRQPSATLTTHAATLYVYRAGLARGIPGRNHLVWEVEVSDGHAVRELLYIDAHSGIIVDQVSGVHRLRRRVHHRTYGNTIWNENDPLPFSGLSGSDNDKVNILIDAAADAYDLFMNLTGSTYASYTGHDSIMHSVFEPQGAECPNAYWNGRSTSYCTEMVSDDVAVHEWTHAYTRNTHDLIYKWQPGALNEAFSDIFSEVADMINGTGTDQPSRVRTSGECSVYGGSPLPELTISSPPPIAGSYWAGHAAFNPRPPWSVEAEIAITTDASGNSDGCEALVGFPAGSIALIDRGSCYFRDKVVNAENAGATGVIVVNNQGDSVITMGGDLPELSIPAVLIGHSDGEAIKAALGQTVNATMRLSASGSDNSLRWLVAEDTDRGAIRDMWYPTCSGNPGATSEPVYQCSEADDGGVHANSGVPNRAFALLVDGGEHNGETINGIGTTKAAHIYWRAMSVYQVPTTDFADHADIIELSCRDLIAAPLTDLTDGAISGETISAEDCAQTGKVMAAVEMRQSPAICGFQPLLAANSPAIVSAQPVYSEGFDFGAQGWSMSHIGVYGGFTHRDWIWTNNVPEGGSGGAIYAVSVHTGACNPPNDQSGVLYADSPPIEIPDQATGLLLVFDHYVATEATSEAAIDGGNIWIIRDDGEMDLVDTTTFVFNPYNRTLETADNGNTNPLAGQPAFSGTDDGSIEGSWGQSQVKLTGLVDAGETIRIRFAFGVNGCEGVDGWYIDNMRLLSVPSTRRAGRRVTSATP
jgi:Zn-dependent metalloprotease